MLRIAILSAFLWAILAGPVFSDSWHIESVDTDGDVGRYSSIALDSGDNPHISYFHYIYPNGELEYSYWTGSSWSTTCVDLIGNVGYYTSIALDSSDYPHISYYDYGNGDLKYAYWNGSAWSISTVDSAGDVGGWTSIALDSSDYPHISYYRAVGYLGYLEYAYWTGSAWSITSVDTTDEGGFSSLALDSLDYPHIAYYDNYYLSAGLRYAYWNGSAWSLTTVEDVYLIGSPSIALDSSDNPHISYNNDGTLEYAYWTGYEWYINFVDTSYGGGPTSIALDSGDNPHISYWDATNDDLKYAYWTGSAWSITSVDTAADVGYYNSIALDSSDNPHISYRDETNDDLKYAWYGPNTSINLTTFSTLSSDNVILLNWSVETTEGEQIAGFNLYRREITPNSVTGVSQPPKNNNDWTQVNSSLITGDNPYAYTDADVQGGITYEYKLEAVLTDETAETLGTTQATTGQPTSFAIVSLYPNPASETMTCLLSVPDAGTVELALYDLSGRMVLEERQEVSEPTEIEAVLDVSCLASGVYTLQASFGGVEASARCVVAR